MKTCNNKWMKHRRELRHIDLSEHNRASRKQCWHFKMKHHWESEADNNNIINDFKISEFFTVFTVLKFLQRIIFTITTESHYLLIKESHSIFSFSQSRSQFTKKSELFIYHILKNYINDLTQQLQTQTTVIQESKIAWLISSMIIQKSQNLSCQSTHTIHATITNSHQQCH
jgi:hypothetical protein